jgi:hypothetical protein
MELSCGWCGEAVSEGDRSEICANAAMHKECAIRSVVGSVAHLERRCGCYVKGSSENDDPGLTKREAAQAAARVMRAIYSKARPEAVMQ